MEQRLDQLERRTLASERQAQIAMDAMVDLHAKIGALEALAIELAARADLDETHSDRLIAQRGGSRLAQFVQPIRRQLMRLLLRQR